MRNAAFGIWACFSLALVAVAGEGCTGNPRLVSSKDSGLPGGRLPAPSSVIVMDPVKLTALGGGEPVQTAGIASGPEAGAEIARDLAAGGMRVIDSASLPEARRPNALALLSKLREDHRTLISAFRDKAPILPQLKELHEAADADYLCVSRVQDRPGLAGFYDPNSGMIHETTSSFDCRVVIISLSDGSVVWGTEAYVRQPLDPNSWSQCLKVLFQASADGGEKQ